MSMLIVNTHRFNLLIRSFVIGDVIVNTQHFTRFLRAVVKIRDL